MSANMILRRRCIFLILVILCDLRCSYGQGPGTVLKIIQSTNGLGKFSQLLAKAELTELYNSNGQYTVFVPNNTAFDNLPYEKRRIIDDWPDRSPELQNFIKFHTLINNKLTTGNMLDNQVYQSMAANGERIFINRRQRSSGFSSSFFGPTVYFVNGAEISNDQKDLAGSNGVVHGLARFIDISSIKMVYGYIADPDDSNLRFKKFYDLISQYLQGYYSILQELSSGSRKFTMFVPNDAAMGKIPSNKLSELQQDPQKLANVVKAHIIPDRVIFTPYVNHNEGFNNRQGRLVRFRRPYAYTMFVNSGGVDAAIVQGNITVYNGVIHVVDHLLDYVYNSVRKTILQESPIFDQYLNKALPATRNALVQTSGVNVFVPIGSAFSKLQGVPGVNLQTDTNQVDKMIRFHILKSYQDIEISSIIGGYESRQYRQTMYDGWNVTVYNDRNESWVQGGYVKARVIRPDLRGTNGRVHLIDAVLGSPYLDIPMLICHDLWLLRTYDYIRSVGMKNYITDNRFTAKRCNFELYGYPPGYDYGSNSYTNNNNNFQQTTYNPFTQQTNSLNSGSQVSEYDMGTCSGCKFTFFVPNSTAIDYFQRTTIGIKIMKEPQRLQYLFKRLLFENQAIALERLSNTNHIFTSKTGERIRILKSMDRDVKIQFSDVTANVIMMDLGATNGLIHIIDKVLYVQQDLTRDVSRGVNLSQNNLVINTTVTPEGTTDAGPTTRADIICEDNRISIHVPADLLPTGREVTWNDPSCVVTNNGTHLVGTIGLDSCGTVVHFNDTHVAFENDLVSESTNGTNAIDFGLNSVIPVQCVYPRRQEVSTSFLPVAGHARFYEKGMGHLQVQMRHARDVTFDETYDVGPVAHQVILNKPVYLKLTLGVVNQTISDISINVDRCFATPSSSLLDSELQELTDNGCPASPSVMVYPSPGSEVHFSFRAFRFTGHPNNPVYVHCQVFVCSTSNSDCIPGCNNNGRKRRAAVGGPNTHLVSSGPYRLSSDQAAGSSSALVAVTGLCVFLAVAATVFGVLAWRGRKRLAVHYKEFT